MLPMIPSVLRGVNLRDLEKIKAIVREAYPSVPQLSAQELDELMQRLKRVRVIGPAGRLLVLGHAPALGCSFVSQFFYKPFTRP